ncbi:MAG: type II secretion system protein GspM [Thiotrichales bacterium]
MNPRDWFEQLQPRERLLVGGGGGALALLAIYLLLWEPMAKQVRELRQTQAAQQTQLDWMRAASAEARALQGTTSTPVRGDGGGSLIGVVESSVSQAGLRGSVRRIEPVSGERISIELRDAPFNTVIGWLGLLQTQHGAEIDEFNASRAASDGLINARFTLKRSV